MASNDFQAVIDQLSALKGDALIEAERKALRAVGSLIQGALIEKAPIQSSKPHGSLEPGALRADIKARVHVATDQSTTTGDVSRVTVGPGPKTAHVALWVENGHANARATKGAATTPAHPFTRPVRDAIEDKAVALYKDTMLAELAKGNK